MGWLSTMLQKLQLRRAPKTEPSEPIDPNEKRELANATERRKRLERLVVAEFGAELSVISGKDIE